jgi:hypothetical protein
MTNNNFNYWEESQYYPKCNKCGQPISSTRYCSRSCWIKGRKKKQTFEDIFDDIIIEKNTYDNMNEWNILKLKPPKTEEEIKKSYRKLVLQCHPDKPNGSSDKFIELQTAYKTLINVC